MLRQLLPGSGPVDPLDLYLADRRPATGRPWVMINAIASADGATAVDGRSTALGDDDDRAVFKAIRTVPDVILVGARTVTAEDYRPVSLDAERRARRLELGKAEVPTLVIVSGRLSIDPEARVFSDPEHRPLVVTGTDASPAKLALLGDAADVAFLGELTPRAILGHLAAAGVVLLEGGPTLNSGFAGERLVDEVNLTISPTLHAGGSQRILDGPPIDPPVEMTLDRVLRGERNLFARYLTRNEG